MKMEKERVLLGGRWAKVTREIIAPRKMKQNVAITDITHTCFTLLNNNDVYDDLALPIVGDESPEKPVLSVVSV